MAREPRGVREYSTGEIVVEWRPRLCFHSHNCIRALPRVFDAEAPAVGAARAGLHGRGRRRPRRCRRERCAPPHGRRRSEQEPLEIEASAGGPLLLRGGVRVLDADGNVLYEGERAALCRCGGSANKPFCDGTHKTNGFTG